MSPSRADRRRRPRPPPQRPPPPAGVETRPLDVRGEVLPRRPRHEEGPLASRSSPSPSSSSARERTIRAPPAPRSPVRLADRFIPHPPPTDANAGVPPARARRRVARTRGAVRRGRPRERRPPARPPRRAGRDGGEARRKLSRALRPARPRHDRRAERAAGGVVRPRAPPGDVRRGGAVLRRRLRRRRRRRRHRRRDSPRRDRGASSSHWCPYDRVRVVNAVS
eukprot:30717-Pelagococcus_subviridis.AAC.10